MLLNLTVCLFQLSSKTTRSCGSEYEKDLVPRGNCATYFREAPAYLGGVDKMRFQQGLVVYDVDSAKSVLQ
jgi:hypothetical protein